MSAAALRLADRAVRASSAAGVGEAVETGPTLDEMRAWPATVSVTVAAGALGISRSAAYKMAAEDAFPCRLLKFGTTIRVVTASLIKFLADE